MTRTRESDAIAWLDRLGVPVPRHVLVRDGASADDVVADLPFDIPCVAKVNATRGGKGNAGLVRICRDPSVLRSAIDDLDAVSDGGGVLVEEYVEGRELYLSVAMDDRRGPVVRLADRGGVGFDAGTAASWSPPGWGPLYDHATSALIASAGVTDRRLAAELRSLVEVLWRAFVASEATLLEINPLRWDGSRATAVGVALEFDEHARRAARGFWPAVDDSPATRIGRPLTPRELDVERASAAEPHLPAASFIEVGGDVAMLVVGGGAGLVCFDRLSERGLRPACIADHSPGGGARKLEAILRAGLGIPGVRGAIFGAVIISLADTVPYAEALVPAVRAADVDLSTFPVVVRLAGPNEAAAHEILATLPGLIVFGREATLEDACDRLADLLGAGR